MDIVGRDAELEIVGRFLNQASEARALLLTGEAGIGKSTIWQAAMTDARARGYRVIGSRPTEAEARLPFAALTDLFGELADELEPDLPEPQRRALDAALLRASGDGVAEPLAVSLAVLALLRAAIGTRPAPAGDRRHPVDGRVVGRGTRVRAPPPRGRSRSG